jgi:hypothetical protein
VSFCLRRRLFARRLLSFAIFWSMPGAYLCNRIGLPLI